MKIEMNFDCREFLDTVSDFFWIPKSETLLYYDEIKKNEPERWGGGTVEPAVGQLLYIINRILQPYKALEFGTNLGYSTWFIGYALKINERGELISLDIDQDAISEAKEKTTDLPIRIYRQDTGDESNFDWLEVEGPFEFAFIDSSHEYDATIKELELLFKLMPEDSIIALHDIYSKGVSKALDQYIDVDYEPLFLSVPTQPNTGLGIWRL